MTKAKNHKNMVKTNKGLDIDQIEATVSKTFKELEEGLKTSNLTKSEWAEINQDLENLEYKAYTIKINMLLPELMHATSELPIRDVIIQLLPHLRQDTSAEMIAQVTKYISEEWEARRLKVVA